MKDKEIPYFLVDNWKRVRKKDFLDWYRSQSHYRLKEVRARDHVLEKESLSVPQMAFLLKIDRDEARAVMTSDMNGLKPFRMLGTTWVSRESFTDWLGRQNRYQMRFRTIENGVKAHRNWVLSQKRISIQNAQRAKLKKRENSRSRQDKENPISEYPSVTSEFVSSEAVKDCLTLNGASLIPEKQEEYSSKVRRNPGQTSLNPDYVSVDEAASIAGVTKTAIRKWITSGRLPARKVVRSYRILRADLERIMKEGE